MNIGIDKIGFATSDQVLDLADLAHARGIDPDKFKIGILQDKMAVTPITTDIVSLGARAGASILTEADKASIDMVIVGTESGIDQSKASAVYIHSLLGIQPFARSIEIKEACFGGTAALAMAHTHILQHPNSKVLVIASDIARYGIGSSGEATQGAGAIAMLVTADPHILVLHDDQVSQTRDIMDFWRPNGHEVPQVDGRFSTVQYIDSLKTTFAEYQKRTGLGLSDMAAMVCHIPFAKQGLKGLQKIGRTAPEELDRLTQRFMESVTYNQIVGNLYTGSLYLSFLSLIETSQALQAGDRILFYSYGSGAVCELFSGHLVEGYQDFLQTDRMARLLERRLLTVEEYEQTFYQAIPLDETGTSPVLTTDPQPYDLVQIQEYKRIYQPAQTLH